MTMLLPFACTYEKEPEDANGNPIENTTLVPGESTTAPAPTTTTTPVPEPDLDAVSIQLEQIAQLDAPAIALASRPIDGGSALYVAQQNGVIVRIDISVRHDVASFNVASRPVLDISDGVIDDNEQGLLGIAFNADGSRLYVAFTGTDAQQHLTEYRMNGSNADANSARELLVVPDSKPNHNGGDLVFGPDGFLYWSMGDGGGEGDPEETGQDPTDLLGDILRIDPDVAPEQRDVVPYAIPDGNPFADGTAGAREVWAYGLRNPWRFSFDRFTGDLWIGDVGQGAVEEIDFLPADGTGVSAGRGANMGWSEMEGDRPYEGGHEPSGAVDPLYTYEHADGGCAVTGGYVYRGTAIPALTGIYVFADYCEGKLRGLWQEDGELKDEGELGPTVPSPTSFGQDVGGELYVLSGTGTVSRIIPG
jgi:glucose/arabinose dehydrogenase